VSWDADKCVSEIRTEPRSGLLLSDKFRESFAYLDRFGISFECWFYHPQIAELIDLANVFPNTIMILNHFGVPLGVGSYSLKKKRFFSSGKVICRHWPNVKM